MPMSFYGVGGPQRPNKFYTYVAWGCGLLLLAYLSLTPVARFRSSSDRLLDSVLNETLGFQKILVINLKSKSDQRDAISLAASLTGLKIEFVDGVTDFDIEHALPNHPEGMPTHADGKTILKPANYGSWRAHMNAIRTIVEENLTSALIIEDDSDWDIRLKSQLQEFAKASRSLVQPVKGSNDVFLDPTNPRTSKDEKPSDLEHASALGRTVDPTTSPYGDISRWDMLWIGHCGSGLAYGDAESIPLGRVLIPDDETAPELQHFYSGYGDSLKQYPNHTRVVSWARGTVCNLAYGVSLPGAKRFIYDMGVKNMTSTTDTMLRRICDGVNGRERRKCVTVNPPLFNQHRGGMGHIPFTRNIRWSTRVNFDNLIEGKEVYHDWWKDGMPLPNLKTGEYPA